MNNRIGFHSTRIYLVAIIFVLFVVRLALPQYVKYLLAVMLFFAGIYVLIEFFKNRFSNIFTQKVGFLIPLAIVLIFPIFAYLSTQDKQSMLNRDMINVFGIVIFSVMVFILIYTKKELDRVLSIFSKSVVFLIILFACLGFVKLYFQLSGIKLQFLYVNGIGYPDGTSLAIDDNFYSLGCIIGLIFLIPFFFRKYSFLFRIVIQFSALVIFLNIFFSTSRRGFIIAFVILFLFFAFWLFYFIFKSERFKTFFNNTRIILIASVSIFSLIIYFLYVLSPVQRNILLFKSGFNQNEVHTFINLITISSKSIFEGDIKYKDVDSDMWQIAFDPRYPYCGWASGNYTPQEELEGENVGIVPTGSVGAKVDKSVVGTESNGNASYFSKLFDHVENGKNRYFASVYCFVSEDFNGDLVQIISNGNTKGQTNTKYDLLQSGRWQKLESSFHADSGKFSTYFSISKSNSISLESMEGYVVFAYPELELMRFNPSNPKSWGATSKNEIYPLFGANSKQIPINSSGLRYDSSSEGRIWENIFFSNIEFLNIKINEGDSIFTSVYCFVSDDFNGNEARLWTRQFSEGIRQSVNVDRYDLNEKDRWVKLSIAEKALKDGWITAEIYFSQLDAVNYSNLKGYVIFAHPVIEIKETKLSELSPYKKDKNDHRYRLEYAGFFTLFQNRTDNKLSPKDSLDVIPGFSIMRSKNAFSGPRTDRWRYALYLFKNEYNNKQKLVGGGFEYTRKFSNLFLESGGNYDYPHNPLLSVLLYSGLIGFLAYLWFIFRAIYYYWIYRKEYWTFGLCFAVAFYFAFFSALTPFDPAIVGLFGVLPYLIHYYHIKEAFQVSV